MISSEARRIVSLHRKYTVRTGVSSPGVSIFSLELNPTGEIDVPGGGGLFVPTLFMPGISLPRGAAQKKWWSTYTTTKQTRDAEGFWAIPQNVCANHYPFRGSGNAPPTCLACRRT